MIDDDGVRDPYTSAVERFLELFQEAIPDSAKKQSLLQFISNTGNTNGLFYKNAKEVDRLLEEAIKFANTFRVPARDRVMLTLLYENCLCYSSTMNGQALAAQKVLEKAHAGAASDERAMLASLAGARDGLFDAPASKKASKDFRDTVLMIAKRRQVEHRASAALFKGLSLMAEHFDSKTLITS